MVNILLIIFFGFKNCLFYLKGRVRGDLPLVHSPNGHSAARSQELPHESRGLKTWAAFCWLPRHIRRELDQTWSSWSTPYGDAGLVGDSFNQYATAPTQYSQTKESALWVKVFIWLKYSKTHPRQLSSFNLAWYHGISPKGIFWIAAKSKGQQY